MAIFWKDIKAQFPTLRANPNLVYLDSAASSQKPDAVIEAVLGYYQEYTANIHRGIYRLSEEATRQYELAREKVARFIGASDPACCIFT